MSERVGSGVHRRSSRGFSLIELLVVVIIIGVLAALAIPTMSTARYDRAAYADAGSIMMLFREARMRAIARGGAELLSMSASGSGASANRGQFAIWEAVTQNPNASGSAARLPVPNCMAPTVWGPLPTFAQQGLIPMAGAGNNAQYLLFIDGVDLNTQTTNANSIEVVADIETQLYYYLNSASPAATSFPAGYVCFTPLGRSYANVVGSAQPVFDGFLPSVTVIEARVRRGVTNNLSSGQIRSVLLPPNGMARLYSHT
jgi:type II secretion system protein H